MAGTYAIYLNDFGGSALAPFTFLSVFNPTGSGKIMKVNFVNFTLGDATNKGSSKAARRISAATLGTTVTTGDILKYDSQMPNPTAEVRKATSALVGVTTTNGALIKSFPGGNQSLAQGDLQWIPQPSSAIILREGEGICFMQNSVGAASEALNFGIEWSEN